MSYLARNLIILAYISILSAGLIGCDSGGLGTIGEAQYSTDLQAVTGYTRGSAQDLLAGEPTPMAPTIQSPLSSETDISSLGLSHPTAKVDWTKKTISLEWSIKNSTAKLKMNGDFKLSESTNLWEASVKPHNLSQSFTGTIRAKAICLSQGHCRHLGIDLYYLPAGSKTIIKQQFEAGGPATISSQESPSVRIDPIWLDSEQEFTGDTALTDYISPAVEDSFFDDFPAEAALHEKPLSKVRLEEERLLALKERQQQLKTELEQSKEETESTTRLDLDRAKEADKTESAVVEQLKARAAISRKMEQLSLQVKNHPEDKAAARKLTKESTRLASTDATLKTLLEKQQELEDRAASLLKRKQLTQEKLDRLSMRTEEINAQTQQASHKLKLAITDEDRQKNFQQDLGRSSDGFIDLRGGGHSVNWVNDGYLIHGTAILPKKTKTYNALFARHSQHYASGMMTSLLKGVMERFEEIQPGNGQLEFTSLSLQKGGVMSFAFSKNKHISHQNGLDADIHYLPQNGPNNVVGKNDIVSPEFDVKRNLDFFRYLVSFTINDRQHDTSIVKFIFVNTAVKKALCQKAKSEGTLEQDHEVHRRIRGLKDHSSHFHLRLRCSPYYVGCRNQAEPVGTKCEN